MQPTRLEHFSDGVFAVAITLLVLDLLVPGTDGSLIGALADEWPNFAAFAVSFVLVGCIWVSHHDVFRAIVRVDRVLLFLNLALLMAVVVVPFATALFARYLAHGGPQSNMAGVLFSGAMLLMGVSFTAVYTRATRHDELRSQPAPAPSLNRTLRFSSGMLVYLASIGLAFLSAPLVLILTGGVAVFYVADQLGAQAAG